MKMLHTAGDCYMKENTSYAKSNLTEALFLLLKEKPLKEISIKELCDRAGLSRLSFYRNYSSKEDILKQHLTGITSVFLDSTSVNFRTTPRREFIVNLLNHMADHKEIISLLLNNGLSYMVKEGFDEAFTRSIDVYHDPYRCYAASGAYFNLVYYWFLNDCKETPEQIAEMDLDVYAV